MTAPALRVVAESPDVLDDLSLVELSAILAAVSARLAERAAKDRAGIAPLLTTEDAAPLLGMNPDTLRKRAKSDPAIRALTVDNGTALVVFDPERIRKFRERRAG